MFDFEKLEVYQLGIEFVDKIFEITESFPSYLQYSLGDQLRRASLSILNNLAEGSGKKSPREKNRYYEISLDSARECIPMLTIALRRKLIKEETHSLLRDSCSRICSMLFRLKSTVIGKR